MVASIPRNAQSFPTMPILHLVVHHRRDSHQPWVNHWIDNDLLGTITTTQKIGLLCEDARIKGASIKVHRCGWGDEPPVICCKARVVRAVAVDKSSFLVEFSSMVSGERPAGSPKPGQNFYIL